MARSSRYARQIEMGRIRRAMERTNQLVALFAFTYRK
jgi:hypothetical protein